MGLLDNESIPRRKMILFFVIDTSGSMIGKKIGSVNDAIENVLPMIGEISDENPDAEINVAALEFSTGTRWLYDCLLYTSPSPRDRQKSRMPSSA